MFVYIRTQTHLRARLPVQRWHPVASPRRREDASLGRKPARRPVTPSVCNNSMTAETDGRKDGPPRGHTQLKTSGLNQHDCTAVQQQCSSDVALAAEFRKATPCNTRKLWTPCVRATQRRTNTNGGRCRCPCPRPRHARIGFPKRRTQVVSGSKTTITGVDRVLLFRCYDDDYFEPSQTVYLYLYPFHLQARSFIRGKPESPTQTEKSHKCTTWWHLYQGQKHSSRCRYTPVGACR